MFSHIFINRLKCIVRDKQTMIWTFAFPIILGTMFRLAIPDESISENFKSIDIAIVDTIEYENNSNFKTAIESVSDLNSDEKMFNISLTSQDEADNLLKNNKISGYILVDSKINLIVKNGGFSQLILKEFINNYLQVSAQYEKIYKENPSAMYKLINEKVQNVDYIKEVSANSNKTNNSLNYYYALIAMACLYGAFAGVKEVIDIEPDQSSKGARVSISPVNKVKLFGYSIFTATIVQILIIFVLLAYLAFILKVDFGNKTIYILLTGVIGSFVGVSFGAAAGVLVKGKEGIKMAVIISVSMVFSFLAGLMYANMKYVVQENFPFFNYINPASLISDSFYSLYYYDSYTKYFQNIGILAIMSVVLYGVVFTVMRRQKYASI